MLVESEELGLQFGLWDVNKQNIIVYGVGGLHCGDCAYAIVQCALKQRQFTQIQMELIQYTILTHKIISKWQNNTFFIVYMCFLLDSLTIIEINP